MTTDNNSKNIDIMYAGPISFEAPSKIILSSSLFAGNMNELIPTNVIPIKTTKHPNH